jgi:hypothetical protein
MPLIKLSNNERKILVNLLMYEVGKLHSALCDGEKQLASGQWIKDSINQHDILIKKIQESYDKEPMA